MDAKWLGSPPNYSGFWLLASAMHALFTKGRIPK
jgi:hypothetical protein